MHEPMYFICLVDELNQDELMCLLLWESFLKIVRDILESKALALRPCLVQGFLWGKENTFLQKIFSHVWYQEKMLEKLKCGKH